MAEFGVKATQMSGPDTGAAKQVRQPTADPGNQIMAGTLMGLAGEAWSGYNLATLETDIEAAATEFKTRQDAPAEMAKARSQEKALSTLWDQTTEEELRKMAPEDFWKGQGEVEKVQTSISSTLEKYSNAYKQGSMTSDELIARVNTATKAAIARQPGLARELVSQAEFYQNLSGVTDQIQASKIMEKAQIDAQKKAIDDENKMLTKWGINPNTVPAASRSQVVAYAFEQERGATQMDTFLKQADVLSKRGDQMDRLLDQAAVSPEAMKTRTAHILRMSADTTSNITTGGYAARYKQFGLNPIDATLRGIQEDFTVAKAQFTNLAAQAGPKGKLVYEAHVKALEDMEKLHMDVAKGGPEAARAQNQLTATKAALGMQTATLEHQLGLANQWASVMGNLGPLAIQYADPQAARTLLEQTNQAISNFMGGYGAPPTATMDLTTRDGQVQGKLIFSSQNPVGDPLRMSEDVKKANDINMINNLKMLGATEDPTKFMQAMDLWSQTGVQEALSSDAALSTRYSPSTVVAVNKFLSDTFANASTTGTLDYDKDANSFVVLNPDKTKNEERTKRVNTMFKLFLSFNGRKTDERIDEAGDILLKVSGGIQQEATPTEPVKREQLGPKVEKAVTDWIEEKKQQAADLLKGRPASGLSVREAAIDLDKRLKELKSLGVQKLDVKGKVVPGSGKLDQATYDKRLRALMQEGERLSKMDRE